MSKVFSKRLRVWEYLWKHYGHNKQVIKAAEECSELATALLQYITKYNDEEWKDDKARVKNNVLRAKVIEEIGDVENMLEQLKQNLSFVDQGAIDLMRIEKIKRVIQREGINVDS